MNRHIRATLATVHKRKTIRRQCGIDHFYALSRPSLGRVERNSPRTPSLESALVERALPGYARSATAGEAGSRPHDEGEPLPSTRHGETLPEQATRLLKALRHSKPAKATIRQWRRTTSRQRITATAITACAIAGLVAWNMLSSQTSAPRARQYLEFKACLLTDAHGITGQQAAPVWAAMEDASLKTHARVQYLPTFGPATVPNTLPYLASLVQRRCDIIIAAGEIPVATVSQGANRFPKTKFLAVGGQATEPNVVLVNPSPNSLHTAISKVISTEINHYAS